MLTTRDWGRMIGINIIYNNGSIFQVVGTLCELLIVKPFNHLEMDKCKPILRKIEDMTEEEKRQLDKLDKEACEKCKLEVCPIDYGENPCRCPAVVGEIDYFDRIGIDQRSWIEKGLAVYTKELEVQ